MRSQPITPEIKKALWAWIQADKLTQTQIADLLGIKTQSVNQWLSGMAKSIRAHNWEALYPLLQDYLPADFETHGSNSPIVTGDHAIGVVHGFVNVGGPEIEDFRRRAQDAIMTSDLDGDTKIQVYHILGKISPKG